MVTGRLPFVADHIHALLLKIVLERPPRVTRCPACHRTFWVGEAQQPAAANTPRFTGKTEAMESKDLERVVVDTTV